MRTKKKYTGISHKTDAEIEAGEKTGNLFSLEDTAFIEQTRPVYDGFVSGQGSHLDAATRDRIFHVIRQVEPSYSVNMWCRECLIDMVKHLFRLYNENK